MNPALQKIKDWAKRPIFEYWKHFIIFAVALSGLPLFLTVFFSMLTGDNLETLAARHFIDSLLTTFALTICVWGEIYAPGRKRKLIPKGRSIVTAVLAGICLVFYFFFYQLEALVTKGLGKESWEVIHKLVEPTMKYIFFFNLAAYVFNVIAGIRVINLYYSKIGKKKSKELEGATKT